MTTPTVAAPRKFSLSKPRPANAPALVLGGGLTGIGVLRSLQRDGIAAYSVCMPEDLPAKSRWHRSPPQMWECTPAPGRLADYLSSVSLSTAVLIPCSDDWTKAVADLPESLQDRFPASVPGKQVVETMVDKWLFAEFAERLDIPRPKTLLIRSRADMEDLKESSYKDMFLKPLDSQEFARRTSVKAFEVNSKSHALAMMDRMRGAQNDGFPILLQEYVPGPASSYYLVDGFVDQHRQIRALIARQRLRMHPAKFGNSTLSETIPLERVRDAVETIERLWSAVEFRGIFDAEFKFDERDGQFKIVEINPRPWWFVQFATYCGVDLCGMAYRDALGLPVKPNTGYAVGRRCVSIASDLAGCWAADHSIGGLLRWLRSLKGVEDILFSWDDPRPGISSALASCKKHLFSRLRRSSTY